MTIRRSPDPRSPEERAAKAKTLQPALFDLLALRDAAQVAHWAVRGPGFKPFHDLFSEAYGTLNELADRVAERIATLGVTPAAGPAAVAHGTSLEATPADMTDGLALCGALADRLEAANTTLHQAMQAADDAGGWNEVTLLSDVSLGVEKLGWMLMSHLDPEDEAAEGEGQGEERGDKEETG